MVWLRTPIASAAAAAPATIAAESDTSGPPASIQVSATTSQRWLSVSTPRQGTTVERSLDQAHLVVHAHVQVGHAVLLDDLLELPWRDGQRVDGEQVRAEHVDQAVLDEHGDRRRFQRDRHLAAGDLVADEEARLPGHVRATSLAGNNAVVINSEVRMPVFSTFMNKPINNAFIRNFQLVQFVDLGTAWNGQFDKIERPSVIYNLPPLSVRIKAGGIGPFVGGYGFGARSTLLGYFLRFDVAWEMNGIFKGSPELYFAMGMDF